MITKKKNIPAATTQTDSGDEATTRRMREHLSDEKDVITTEDIRNAKTGDLHKVPERTINENEALSEKKIRDNEDNDINTSWNILESQ